MFKVHVVLFFVLMLYKFGLNILFWENSPRLLYETLFIPEEKSDLVCPLEAGGRTLDERKVALHLLDVLRLLDLLRNLIKKNYVEKKEKTTITR